MKSSLNPMDKLMKNRPENDEGSVSKEQALPASLSYPEDANAFQNAAAFKRIYTHYMSKKEGQDDCRCASPKSQIQDAAGEMAQAEKSFQTMMELHRSIYEAYQDLQQLNSNKT